MMIDTPNKTILVVEDDETSYILIEAVLALKGYALVRAFNGSEALNILEQNKTISLILMDMKMPVMDGTETTRKIRETNTQIPIVAQTAFALSGDKEKALNSGCDDYITKPINRKDLLSKIEKYINR